VSGNDSSSLTTHVIAATADLAVTNVDLPDQVSTGGALSYTLTVSNAGPSPRPAYR
jgi:hypothetical protein